jgi:hypothetical protein
MPFNRSCLASRRRTKRSKTKSAARRAASLSTSAKPSFRILETHDLWAGDPAFIDLLARLQRGNTEFSSWWQAHDIRRSRAGVKRLHLPDQRTLKFQYASFQANDDPALKLVIFAPA